MIIVSFIIAGLLPTLIAKTLFLALLEKPRGLKNLGARLENLPADFPGRGAFARLLKKTENRKGLLVAAHTLSLLACTFLASLLRGGWYGPLLAFGAMLVPQSLWLALDLFLLKKREAPVNK